MPFCHHPVTACLQPAGDCFCLGNDSGSWIIWESPAECKERQLGRTAVCQLFQDHFEIFVRSATSIVLDPGFGSEAIFQPKGNYSLAADQPHCFIIQMPQILHKSVFRNRLDVVELHVRITG
jgi:hypothetical protein